MRDTPVVWRPWDFLGSPLQHHLTPGPSQGGRAHLAGGNPTSPASRAWGPPPRQDQLVWQCLSSRRAQVDRHFSRSGGEHSISDQKKEPFPEAGWAERCWGTAVSRPLSWMFSSLWGEVNVLCPVNKPAAVYLELGTVWDLQLTGACQPLISPELPQQLQGVNLRPWSPCSSLLKFAISNVTAQVLPLTQNEEFLRDVEQIMS